MNQQNQTLCLHAGGHQVSLDQVAEVRTPDAVGIWYPIPHAELHRQTVEALTAMGMRITRQEHALARDGDRYFGLLHVSRIQRIDHEEEDDNDPIDYGYVVGLRNSHDKKYPAGLVVGSRVFVCDNLSF